LPPLPYPGKRPYPNPLDGNDAATDYDGDGLRGYLEHQLWQKFGARAAAEVQRRHEVHRIAGAGADRSRA
jgi:hypothetical protein